MMDFCEQGNEISGIIKGGEYDLLSDCQVLE